MRTRLRNLLRRRRLIAAAVIGGMLVVAAAAGLLILKSRSAGRTSAAQVAAVSTANTTAEIVPTMSGGTPAPDQTPIAPLETGEPPQYPLRLTVPESIHVGESLVVDIEFDSVGETANLTGYLFNGLQTYTESIVTGTGGVARWSIFGGIIRQAGTSLILVTDGGLLEARALVQVVPGNAENADLLTTGNNFTAYGDARVMLIGLLRDAYGNPVSDSSRAQFNITDPQGNTDLVDRVASSGLVWTWFTSHSDPGRVRTEIEQDDASAYLELHQTSGAASRITLTLDSDCALSGGRDTIRLHGSAADGHGSPVVDGTVINFTGDTLTLGSVVTTGGAGWLDIPAPAAPGDYKFTAWSGNAFSAPVTLHITDDVCP